MFKITWDKNGDIVFKLSGRIGLENVEELKTLFSNEAKGRRIALDLSQLTLVDEVAVSFLGGCETNGIELKNCPGYIREWITRERRRD